MVASAGISTGHPQQQPAQSNLGGFSFFHMPRRFPPSENETAEQREIRELIEVLELIEQNAYHWSPRLIEKFAAGAAESARKDIFGQVV